MPHQERYLKQDWYLKQCDITQYVLRNSSVMKGELAIDIPSEIRLIVVARQQPTDKIYFDILAAIHLSEPQVLFLTPQQLIVPANKINQVTWFIGVIPPDSWQDQQRMIQTDELKLLAKSPLDKRKLWQQLCQYERHFTTGER